MTSLFFNKFWAVSKEAIAVCAACVILIGCGGGGGGGGGAPAANPGGVTPGGMTPGGMTPGGGLPGTTFTSGNIAAADSRLTALTNPDNVANRVNIAGDLTIIAPATTADLSFATHINAGGNAQAPTNGTETVAQALARVDSLWIVDGGVVNRITASADNSTPGNLNIQGFEAITIDGGTVNRTISNGNTPTTYTFMSGTVNGPVIGGGERDTFNLIGGTVDSGYVHGGNGGDHFVVTGNTVADTDDDMDGTQAALTILAALDGDSGGDGRDFRLEGADRFWLDAGGVVGNITNNATAASDVELRNFEVIIINGGTVNGNIHNGDTLTAYDVRSGTVGGGITGGTEPDTFELRGGTITGFVFGGDENDFFYLYSAVTINGYLDGGAGMDVLRYAGAAGTTFPGGSGLAADTNLGDTAGSVRGIETLANDPNITSLGTPGAGLRGLTVRGIEVLGLSPALNLYGALSDALMQFGAQTAQGFALADLNLATGRGTSLASKDSPFSKGRIWAHKITHSGNGKGSIGLNLTGLTARDDSDYDYEMSLTQHGFDAPLATTKLGAFNLRAVSHTMTGTIETNVAEAKVSGYGAGVALQWRGQNLVAHLTSLAGAYEVEAHTSPLNPRAVVNEVSEGSFSAINAVVSAGVADTRKLSHSLVLRTTADIVWQTLSLDDFTETGSGGSAAHGIAINFDKATRLTARVGAGLEAEHWFSDVAFVHETSSGGTLSSGLSQDYRQDDGTAIEMKLGGKIADLATGLTLKAYAGLRTSLINGATLEPSARFDLSWRF